MVGGRFTFGKGLVWFEQCTAFAGFRIALTCVVVVLFRIIALREREITK